jgi:hypothetical protein
MKMHKAVRNVGICGMDITFDHIVMHEPINHIMGLVFSGANDEGIREEVPHVDEGIGTDAFVLAEVFEGVAGMERIHRDFKLLTIAGGMQEVIGLAVDLGERELIHELHHTIIRPMDIVQREVPVDRTFQLRFREP